MPETELQHVNGWVMRMVLFFGHGRMMEGFVILLKLLFGFGLDPDQVLAFQNLKWDVPWPFLSLPWLVIGLTQAIGLGLNYLGYESSRVWRLVGATLAESIWIWIIGNCLLVGATGSALFWVSITCFLASLVLIWKSLMDLPKPGTIGLR